MLSLLVVVVVVVAAVALVAPTVVGVVRVLNPCDYSSAVAAMLMLLLFSRRSFELRKDINIM